MEIPAELARTQSKFLGARGRAFIDALPGRAADFLRRWGLRRTGPAMHGMCALVLPVERADGTPAVLKLQILDEETAGEPVALRLWDGDGAVRLLEYDEETGTLLLERLDAARDLTGVPVRDGVAVIAGLLARLTASPAPAGLRTLDAIAGAMLDETPSTVRAVSDGAQRRLLLDCAAAVREVAGEPGDRLLHWDLHFENVLAPVPLPVPGAGGRGARGRGREPWLAIDPKPLAGDPGFELLPAVVNRFDAGGILWRFDLMTEVMGLDRERARAWSLGRVLQSCLWDIKAGDRALSPVHLAVGRELRDHRARPRTTLARRPEKRQAAVMIRTATAADVPVIHTMIRELAACEKAPDEARATEAQLREALFGVRPAAYAHIAETDDGEVAGFALWFLNFSTWRGVHGIYLEDLYVRPELRGGGHGKALLTELARICVERGYERLEWSVLDWNEPSIAFYRALGARPQDGWTVFRLTDGELAALGAPGAPGASGE